MNTVFTYVIGHGLLNNRSKFHGDTTSRSRENDIESCYFRSLSGDYRTKIAASARCYGLGL